MDKITGLMGLLGEDNNKKIKDNVTQFIIDAIEDDIRDYNRESYILDPEEIIGRVDTTAYDKSVEQRKEKEKLKKELDKRKKEIQKKLDDEYYASKDETYAEMLRQYESL